MTPAPRKILFLAALLIGVLGACLDITPYPTLDSGGGCGPAADGGDAGSCDAGGAG